ncbi:MAG: ribonuclease E inhibitor RraB [Planctomycetota bacterium]
MTPTVRAALVVAALFASCAEEADHAATPPRTDGAPRVEVLGLRDGMVRARFVNDSARTLYVDFDGWLSHLEFDELLYRPFDSDLARTRPVEPGESIEESLQGWNDGLPFAVGYSYRFVDADGEERYGSAESRTYAPGELSLEVTEGDALRWRPRASATALDPVHVLQRDRWGTLHWTEDGDDGAAIEHTYVCGGIVPQGEGAADGVLSVEIQVAASLPLTGANFVDAARAAKVVLEDRSVTTLLATREDDASAKLWFAARDLDELQPRVRSRIGAEFEAATVLVQVADDPDLSVYRRELVPPKYVRLGLATQYPTARPRAARLGDVPGALRPVQYRFTFRDDADARAFAAELEALDARDVAIDPPQTASDGSSSAELRAVLDGALTESAIEARVRDLGRRALRDGGDLVGWSAPIVPEHPSPVVRVGASPASGD